MIPVVFFVIFLFLVSTNAAKEKPAEVKTIATNESKIPEQTIPTPSPEILKSKIVKPKTETPIRPTENTQNTQSATILAGDATYHLSFSPGTLLYDALVEGKNMGAISFIGKNYPSLGFFVTDIGPLHSGEGKDLLYYVNGKEATVGVSGYILKNGDVIEWKLE